jgi:preprotein translocase subunit SecF
MSSFKETLVDIFHERTNFNFIGNKRRWFAASGIVILIGIISLSTRGLNYGIEFKGGTQWRAEIQKNHTVTVSQVRDKLRPYGLSEAQVAITREIGTGKRTIRVQGPALRKDKKEDIDKEDQVSDTLASLAGLKSGNSVTRDAVSSTWGSEVSRKAVQALIAFFIAIVIYLSVRFEPKMAVAAVVAVLHDIIVTVGVYSVSHFEVTPATVVAFLTILGYSLYDTVVVFDKVDENVAGLAMTGRETYSDVVNKSMNQVLMRSLNTSIVALIPVFSLLVVGAYLFGATTTRDFALALFIGLLSGAYSSIFTASPILAMWKEHEPRYAALRSRIKAKQASGPAPVAASAPAAAAAAATATASPAPDVAEAEANGEPVSVRAGATSPPRPANRPGGGGAPRPRKKKRRR